MKHVFVTGFTDHRDSYTQGDIRLREVLFDENLSRNGLFSSEFDENATYEEIVRKFVQRRRLPPLDDPRLRYNLVLQVFERHYDYSQGFWRTILLHSLSRPVTLREGQTLARTHLTRLVPSVEALREHTDVTIVSRTIFCAISLEIRDSLPPEQKPSGTSPNWGQITVGGILGFLIGETANVASIIGALDVIERRWREWHTTHNPHPQQGTSHLSATDIVVIRLRMTHGPDHEFEEWLTDPERLKHYIDVFNQPSSSIQPLQAIFVQRNGRALKVDVSKGTQNNLQLNELLSHLNIDTEQQ